MSFLRKSFLFSLPEKHDQFIWSDLICANLGLIQESNLFSRPAKVTTKDLTGKAVTRTTNKYAVLHFTFWISNCFYGLMKLLFIFNFKNFHTVFQWSSISDFGSEKVMEYFDPLGQPKVKAGRDHCFRTCCPSPLFKSRKIKQKTMFATSATMGLAEGIIDDSCPILFLPRANNCAMFVEISFLHGFW